MRQYSRLLPNIRFRFRLCASFRGGFVFRDPPCTGTGTGTSRNHFASWCDIFDFSDIRSIGVDEFDPKHVTLHSNSDSVRELLPRWSLAVHPAARDTRPGTANSIQGNTGLHHTPLLRPLSASFPSASRTRPSNRRRHSKFSARRRTCCG
jgi:hypothetical protein